MPYNPPSGPDASPDGATALTTTTFTGTGLREELQVRLTAQRILTRHLIWPRYLPPFSSKLSDRAPAYWGELTLDLTGARLISFNFMGCRVTHADFGDATFDGPALFVRATFVHNAIFRDARFTALANFDEATFGEAVFVRTSFGPRTFFDRAVFTRRARFDGAAFRQHVSFQDVSFEGSSDEAQTKEGRPQRLSFTGARILGDPTPTDIRLPRPWRARRVDEQTSLIEAPSDPTPIIASSSPDAGGASEQDGGDGSEKPRSRK